MYTALMRTFYQLLGNGLIVATKNNFIWFAIIFWIYLETQSVISTAFVGGIYTVASAVSAFWFGSLVDHHHKKNVMLGSSIFTLVSFGLGLVLYMLAPDGSFSTINSPLLWVLVLILLAGVIAGSIFNIAIPTLVTTLVPEDRHDRANGILGSVMGISFSITSFASGLILGFFGMFWVLITAVFFSVIAVIHLLFISIPEKKIIHTEDKPKSIDIPGTIAAISAVPGLFALIFFTTFNNLLGGVFMALMDAYGLTLVSVQVWGSIFGVLSFGFIIGGMYIAKKGLGTNPLRSLFRVNMIMWATCIFFTIQPSIVLLVIGIFIWMCLMPFVEAIEQTIVQKVVPVERQGRVFGFAQSVEQAATPLTAFLIGPIAEFIFIPFMTTGAGVDLIGDWFGTGPGRGIALVFTISGIIGLIVTFLAMRSNSYKVLAKAFLK